jgi:alanine dehydrogenase
VPGYHIAGAEASGWRGILNSLGLPERPVAEARVIVLGQGAGGTAGEWLARADGGAVLIVEGNSDGPRCASSGKAR